MRYLAVLTAIALAAASVSPAFSAGRPDYMQSTLKLSGELLGSATGDMDGDGLIDIAAVSLKDAASKNPSRVIDVFLQKKGKGFSAKPDMSWLADADAAAFDLGDVTGSGRASFCYLSSDGLYAYLPKGGGFDTKPKKLVSRDVVFPQPDPRDMPHWPMFVQGVKGGPDVALLPGVGSLGICGAGGAGGYSSCKDAKFPVKTRFTGGPKVGGDSSLTIYSKLPSVTAVSSSPGSGPDLAVDMDDSALLFRRGSDGSYPSRPSETFAPGLLKPDEDGPMDGAWTNPLDVNGDGRLDYIVVKKTGGVIHTKSLIFVYTRGADGTIPAKPGSTIITEGVVGPRFVDVNGDGRLDILLPSVKVGVSNFINMLTSSQVNVDVAIYVQNPNGRYPDTPTKTKTVGFKLDLSNIMRATPVLEAGRFSKDKSYGLIVVTKDDLVSVFLPDRYSILSDRPGLELKVPGPTGLTVSDLNADGIDDIVMTYTGSGKNANILNVFVSK